MYILLNYIYIKIQGRIFPKYVHVCTNTYLLDKIKKKKEKKEDSVKQNGQCLRIWGLVAR